MDFTNEFSNIDQINARIHKMSTLAASIKKAQGMSKSFAMEAQSLLPNFGDGASSVYYTAQPSITRYWVSMEELTVGIWALIAAGIAAAALLLRKVWKWIFKKGDGDSKSSKGGGSSFGSPDEKTKKIEISIETRKTETNVMRQVDDLLKTSKVEVPTDDGKYMRVDSLDGFIGMEIATGTSSAAAALKNVLATSDKVMFDIIKQGKYYQILSTASTSASSILKLMSDTESLFGTLDTKLGQAISMSSSEDDDKLTFNELSDKKPFMIRVSSTDITFADLVAKILDVKSDLEDHTASTPILFSQLNGIVDSAISKSGILAALKEISRCEAKGHALERLLDVVGNSLKNLAAKQNKSTYAENLGTAVKHAYDIAMEDVRGCLHFITMMNSFSSELVKVSDKASAAHEHVLVVLGDKISKSKGKDKDELRSIRDRINLFKKDLSKAKK